jgi:hypothetical protein
MINVILQIFGILFILSIAAGGYLVYRLVRFWKRIRREVQQETSLDTPSRLTLIEVNDPAWGQHAALKLRFLFRERKAVLMFMILPLIRTMAMKFW